jgi:hypothetical protein
MQRRKCCNHLFLLNGIEVEVRKKEENRGLNEGDLLAKTSGKLILLDKLLPRLKDAGSRILIFSQFKIMLDILVSLAEISPARGSTPAIDGENSHYCFQLTGRLFERSVNEVRKNRWLHHRS